MFYGHEIINESKHWQSRVRITYCFPKVRSQYVFYYIPSAKNKKNRGGGGGDKKPIVFCFLAPRADARTLCVNNVHRSELLKDEFHFSHETFSSN